MKFKYFFYDRPRQEFKGTFWSFFWLSILIFIFVIPSSIGRVLPWRPVSEFSRVNGTVTAVERVRGGIVLTVADNKKFWCGISLSDNPEMLKKNVTILYRKSRFFMPSLILYEAGVVLVGDERVYVSGYAVEAVYERQRMNYMLFMAFFIVPIPLSCLFMIAKANLSKKGF